MFSPTEEPVRGAFGDPGQLRLTGVERFSGLTGGARRQPPPIHYLTGLIPVSAEFGASVFELPVTPWLQGPVAGLISGGVLAFAADAPLSGAINTTRGPGEVATTSQLSLNFVAAGSLASQTIKVRGEQIHVGRRQGLSEARIEDASGKLLAHATTRCVVLDMGVPPASEPVPFIDPEAEGWIPPFKRPVEGAPLEASVWQERSGLEVVRGIQSGEFQQPPLGRLLGTRVIEAGEGLAVVTLPCTPWLGPPAPSIYGGAIALFADIALANSLLSTLPAGGSYATLDLIVYFIRPVQPDGRRLTARAEVVHRGRSLAVAECVLSNEDGKTVARAVTSAFVTDRPFG